VAEVNRDTGQQLGISLDGALTIGARSIWALQQDRSGRRLRRRHE